MKWVFVLALQPSFQIAFHLKKHQIDVFRCFWMCLYKKWKQKTEKILFWCIFNWKTLCTTLPNTLEITWFLCAHALFFFFFLLIMEKCTNYIQMISCCTLSEVMGVQLKTNYLNPLYDIFNVPFSVIKHPYSTLGFLFSISFFVWVFVHWHLNSTELTKELSQQLCVHMFLYLWMHFKMFLWVMRCLVLDFQFFICFLICSPFPSDNVSMFYLISVNLLFPWPVVYISEDIWNNFLTSFWLPLES